MTHCLGDTECWCNPHIRVSSAECVRAEKCMNSRVGLVHFFVLCFTYDPLFTQETGLNVALCEGVGVESMALISSV